MNICDTRAIQYNLFASIALYTGKESICAIKMGATNRIRNQASISITLRHSVLAAILISVLWCPAAAEENCSIGSPVAEWNQVEFSLQDLNLTYKTKEIKVGFGDMGMQPFYNMAHFIINNLIGSENPLPPGYLEVDEYHFHIGKKAKNNEWAQLILRYWRVVLQLLIMGIAITLVPLFGLYYCCCQCADQNNCEPCDRKHDGCRRICYGLLLIILTVGILFGVILAFVNNQFIEIGLREGRENFDAVLDDLETYTKMMAVELTHVIEKNHEELLPIIIKPMEGFPHYIIEKLVEESRISSALIILKLLNNLIPLRKKIIQLQQSIKDLQIYAVQLTDALRGVKREYFAVFENCDEIHKKDCENLILEFNLGNLDAGLQYDMLLAQANLTKGIDALINQNYTTVVNKGFQNLANLCIGLKQQLAPDLQAIHETLTLEPGRIEYAVLPFKKQLESVSKSITSHARKFAEVTNEYISDLETYRYYSGLAVCFILLLILISLIFALCCGICGKRTDDFNDDACNKATGAKFLKIANILIFLTFSMIALTTLVYFLMGVILYRGACIPLSDLSDPLFQSLDRNIDLKRFFIPGGETIHAGIAESLSASNLIEACKSNQTIYDVLAEHNLYYMKNVYDFLMKADTFSQASSKFNEKFSHVTTKPFVLFNKNDWSKIKQLSIKELDLFDATVYKRVFDELPTQNLNEVAKAMRQLANKLPDKNNQVMLRNQALHLESYDQNLLKPLNKACKDVNRLGEEIGEMLMPRHKKFSDSMDELISDAENGERYIIVNGTEYIKNTGLKFSVYLRDQLKAYLNEIYIILTTKLGDCKPIMRIYSTTWASLCLNIVDPLNGFWLGVYLCLLLFLPVLCVSKKLICLYQKAKPYPGPLAECVLCCEISRTAMYSQSLVNMLSGARCSKCYKKEIPCCLIPILSKSEPSEEDTEQSVDDEDTSEKVET